MKTVISAGHLFLEDDGYVKTIGFANDGDTPTDFMIVQRSHSHDDQDRSLGMDKIHVQIESGNTSASFYGGIMKIISLPGKIIFIFDEVFKKKYAIDGDVELELDKGSSNLYDVLSELEHMSRSDGVEFIRDMPTA